MSVQRAYIQMHISILLWGFTGILGKAISLSEGMTVWYRMLISAIGLFFLMLTIRSIKIPSFKNILYLSGLGAMIALHWVLFFASIKYSNVSVALSCFASISLFTAIIEPIINRKRPSWFEIFLGLIAIGGIYIIFSFQKFYGLGILFALLSSLGGAIFTVYNKNILATQDPVPITFL